MITVPELIRTFRTEGCEQDARLSGYFKRYLAFDTETDGLDVRSTCRPFLLSCGDGQHNWTFRIGDVSLKTGRVKPNADEIRQFEELAANYDWFVGFNTNFDVHAVSHFSDFFLDKLDRCLDVQIMSWALDNLQLGVARKGSVGLKYQAYKVCRVPYDDLHRLKNAVTKARTFAKKKGFLYPGTRTPAETYWLPRALWEKYPTEVPPEWETLDEEYCELDAGTRTAALFVKYCERLDKKGWWRPYLERQTLATAFFDIERRGLPVVEKNLDDLVGDAAQRALRAQRLCEKIVKRHIPKEEFSFNIGSDNDVRIVLYDVFGLPVVKRTGKKRLPSTDEYSISTCLSVVSRPDPEFVLTEGGPKDPPLVALQGFEDEFVFLSSYQAYQRWSGAESKARGYVKKLFDKRLFPSYNLGSTKTTRPSSENPNGQNISKGDEDKETHTKEASLRTVFGPPPGEIWYDVDLDQNQLRIYASLSGDEGLQGAFDRGDDIHDFVARAVYDIPPGEKVSSEIRRRAKAINFGIIFGSGKTSTDARAGEGSFEMFLQMFPGLARFMAKCRIEVENTGGVTLPNGLFLAVEPGKSYVGANYVVQGVEGLQVGDAVREIYDYFQTLKGNAYTYAVVHDSVTFGIRNSVKPTIRRNIVRTVAEIMRDAGNKYGIAAKVKIESTVTTLEDSKPYTKIVL